MTPIETPEQYRAALARLEELKAGLIDPIANSGGLTDMAFYEWMKPMSDEYGDLQFELYYYLIGSSPELQDMERKGLLRYIYSRGYVYISKPDTGSSLQYDGNRLIALANELLALGRMLQPEPPPKPTPILDRLRDSGLLTIRTESDVAWIETGDAQGMLTGAMVEQLTEELKTIRMRMKG